MCSILKVIREIFSNLLTIHRLSINELIVKNKGNFLGVLWLWLNPAFQIIIYVFVYGNGIRNRKPVSGHDFIYWLISGFVMWMFINGVVTKGAKSIIKKINLISKMRFPVSITPAVTVISELYIHLMMLATVMVILVGFGDYSVTKYWLYLPYFTFSAMVFLYSLSLFNSAITMMFRDYQHIVYNSMRAMFFLSPVIFPIQNATQELGMVMKINPFTYLMEGYRDILIFGRNTVFLSYRWGAYFWMLTIILFVFGSIIHVQMRKNLLDYK